MSGKSRINAEERKRKIIDAAKPLFASNGFNGTSVRDIAKAADVSNALLYKHFPSKEAMYDEILSYSDWLYPKVLGKMTMLEPSTETLVFLIYALFRFILFEVPGGGPDQKKHERLLFYSLLEGNDYSRKALNKLYGAFEDIINKNFHAAEKKGDIEIKNINRKSRFWFAHHIAMALNLCHLSDTPAFDYDTSFEKLMEDAVCFALRGIGMSVNAIDRYFQPAMFKKRMELLQ